MPIQPSKEQQTFFNWVEQGTGNALLVAVAGAGKSTTLVLASAKMKGLVAGMAYNKKAAVDLTEKSEIAGLAGRANWGTCHSFGLQIFKANKKYPKIDTAGDKHKKLMEHFGTSPAMWNFYRQALSMAKQRGFGLRGQPTIKDSVAWDDMIEEYSIHDSLPVEEAEIPSDYLQPLPQMLIKSNYMLDLIDFDDMIYLPLVHDWQPGSKYDWVLLDEAQDTNPARRILAATLLRPTGRFVAVGDPHQAIYGFTGADSNALAQISDRFSTVELPLSVSFRCAQAIVREAHCYVSHILAHPDAPAGLVDTVQVSDSPNWAFKLKPGDAVLCRNTKPLVSLAFQLIRAGIGAKVEGRAIGQGLKALVRKWKWATKQQFDLHLVSYRETEVKAALAKKKNQHAEYINDKVESLRSLLAEAKSPTPASLCAQIDSMFEDGVRPNFVLLSTIHKAKGREWDHVYWLGPNKYQPSPFAQQDWELEQENNLMYVAATRAKSHLTKVIIPND